MSEYFIYYIESNLVCFIIFAILLLHNIFGKYRQEIQIKYNRALISFMLYFVSDCFWAGVDSGVIVRNTFTVIATNFFNYIFMAAITYSWLNYVMAVEKIPNRNRTINKSAVLFPFTVSLIVFVMILRIKPGLLINEELEMRMIFNILFLVVPYIYIIAVIVYAVRRAMTEENYIEKHRHLYVGFFPLLVIAGGFVELFFLPTMPIFCFSCTILMLIFYIQSMDQQISTDALTKLNNRGQLIRYVSQKSNLYKEGRKTFVIMMDINNFKTINDVYGHAEGDRALIIVAEALRQSVKHYNFPMFLGRYGGDEFVLIIHPSAENFMEEFIPEIRGHISTICEEEGTPYSINVGIGYDELYPEGDSFQQCQERADNKLYLDKAASKKKSKQSD